MKNRKEEEKALRNIEINQRSNKLKDDIADGKIKYRNTMLEQLGVKFDGEIHQIPDITSAKWMHRNSYDPSAKDKAIKESQNLLNQIMNDKLGVYQTNNIAGSMSDVSSHYGNSAQNTWEVMNYLNEKVLTSPDSMQYIIVADTEWVGGGQAGRSIPVELGYQVVGINKDGSVHIVEDGNYSSHVRITSQDRKSLQKTIDKIKAVGTDPNGVPIPPRLSDDEYRSIKDLVNIAYDASMNPGDKANKSIINKVVDGDNIALYLKAAEEGLDILTGGAEAKISSRIKVGNDINRVMMKYKTDVVLTHNGLMSNSDLDVWNSVPSFARSLGNKKQLDTLSMLRTVLKDPLTEIYGNVDSVTKPLTLEDISRAVFPDVTHKAHTAGSDAELTAHLFKYIWENDKYKQKLLNLNKDPNNVWKKGTKLYATGSIGKSSPLDMILSTNQIGDNLEVHDTRYYQDVATYKNATYTISEEFQTTYKDDVYYGVILKNEDDLTTHTVAFKNQRDLQNAIQKNFISMDIAGDNAAKATRDYVLKSRAMTEYADLFSGPNAPYRFDKYVNATAYIRANIRNATNADGTLKDKAIQSLIENQKLTQSQAEKFKYMYSRMNSEYKVLNDFNTIIKDSKMNNSAKSAALWKFKEQMDEVYGSHKTSLKLPSSYRQGRIRDFKGNFVGVDLRSQEDLTASISRILLGEKYSDFGYDLSNVKANARTMIYKMSYGDNAILSTKEARKLIDSIDKLNVKSVTGNDRGYTSGVSYLSQSISNALYENIDNIERVKEVEDLESLDPRKLIAQEGKKKITKRDMLEYKKWGEGYFATKDSPLKFNAGQIESKLDIIDKAIVKNIDYVTGGAISKNKDIAPTKIIKELENLSTEYGKKGIRMQIDLTSGDKVGLQIKMFADQYSTSVTEYQGKKAAEVFIPLMNPETGMFHGSSRTMNLITPIIDSKKGTVRYSTYQEELIRRLSFRGVVDEVESTIKYGDVSSASSYMSRIINDVLEGIPVGSMYNKEINGQLVGSNKAMNQVRRGWVDLNNLVYQVTKANRGTGYNVTTMNKFEEGGYPVDGTKFLNYLYIGPEFVRQNFTNLNQKELVALKDAEDVYKYMQQLGIKNFNFGALKGERAQKGTINLVREDPRNYIIGGWFGDPGREMARQSLNFFTLSDDDFLEFVDGDNVQRISRGRYRQEFFQDKKKSSKEKLRQRRMLSRYSETTKFHQEMEGTGASVTLRAAFVTDKEISESVERNFSTSANSSLANQIRKEYRNKFNKEISEDELREEIERRYQQIPITQRMSVHDDMGVINADALTNLTVNRERSITLGSGYVLPDDIREQLDSGQGYWLNPNDIIGESPFKDADILNENDNVLYKDPYSMFVRGYTIDEDKGFILVGDQVIRAGEGTKMADLGGGTKLTSSALSNEYRIGYQMGSKFEDIDLLMSLSMDKGGSGTAISSQINMAMEQIQLIDTAKTVGDREKKKITKRVNEIAASLVEGGYSKANKMSADEKGKIVKARMQEEVNAILQKNIGTSEIKFVEQQINGMTVTTAVVPTNVKGSFTVHNLMEDFDSFFKKYGINVTSNVIEDGSTKVRIGNVAVAMMNVEPGNKVVGFDGEGTKISLRNLEFLRNKSKYLDMDMSPITNYFESLIAENALEYNGQGKWMANSMLDVAGVREFSTQSVGFVRTSGKSTLVKGFKDGGNYFDVKDFEDLNTFSATIKGQVYERDLRGTIVDNIFDDRAFYLELPEEITFGSKQQYKTDKVLMVPTSTIHGPDGVYLREEQKAKKGVYDSIAKYKNFQKSDKSKVAPDEIKETYANLKKGMADATERYYHEIAKATQAPNGDYVEMISSTRLPHSGRFAARGISPNDELNKRLINKLNEGDILVNSESFKQMMQGYDLSEDVQKELLEKARTEGIYGMTIRDPVKDFTSQLPVNIRVMSEAEEKALKNIDGVTQSAWMTLGTQIALGADFDGDQFALLMPMLGGVKAKNLQNATINDFLDSKLYKSLGSWFEKENVILQKNADFLREFNYNMDEESKKLMKEMFGNGSDINARRAGIATANTAADLAQDRVLEVSSRMNKQVGLFSVMASRYRAVAETVGSSAVDQITKEKANLVYTMMTFVGSGNEQAAISSKRLQEVFKEGILQKEGYEKYINASENLIDSMRNADMKGIVSGMIDIGAFEEVEILSSPNDEILTSSGKRRYKLKNDGYKELITNDAGEQVHQKAYRWKGGKTEGIMAATILEGSPDIIYTAEDILDAFQTMEDTVGKSAIRGIISGSGGIGFSEPYSAEKGIKNVLSLFTPNQNNATDSTPLNIITKGLYGDELIQRQREQLAKGASEYSKIKPLGGEFYSAKADRAAKKTMEESAEEIAQGFSSSMLSKVGIGAAVLGGGAWLASAIIPGPSTRRNVQQGEEDQAPSSDGTYVNPAIYAGAPPGAAPPTARVSPMGTGYDKVNINVSASSMNGMTNEEIANVIAGEVQRQSGVSMNINIKSEDNTANIDRQWLQQQFSNALNTGWTY